MTKTSILVCLWDDQLGRPVTRFLHMPVCNIGTADKLFNAIDSTLEERKILWCNVVGFESNTTNVMMGNITRYFLVSSQSNLVCLARVVYAICQICD